MGLEGKTLKVCSCNKTVAIDGRALAAALKDGAPLQVHRELCRKDAAAFQAALGDAEVIVACTQEAPLFGEIAEAAGARPILRFVNLREQAGWSSEGAQALPKIAALVAAAAMPEPEPVPAVSFKSGGQLLVIGPASAALDWAERLSGALEVNVLITDARGAELPLERKFPIWSGKVRRLAGWLGAFWEVEWTQENPIDLETCTRCNACIRACPEQAIDYSYQIDMAKCKAHRACVKACGAIGAVDFSRGDKARKESFDLVFDLSRQPLLKAHDAPQGYVAPGADPLEQALAAHKLASLVGEFEKPRFVHYRERICAHGRSGKIGCSKCLDVCSTAAISEHGDYVKVEPHLCAGCGGCATVCPSGAMAYQYPGLPDMGLRLKTLLSTYREAGGENACVLFHDHEAGRSLVQDAGPAPRKLRPDAKEMKDIEKFVMTPLRSNIQLGFHLYHDSDSLDIYHWYLSGAYALKPETWLQARIDMHYLRADKGSGLENIDGDESTWHHSVSIGVMRRFSEKVAADGYFGGAYTEDDNDIIYGLGANFRPVEELRFRLSREYGYYLESARTASLGIKRGANRLDVQWQPDLRYTILATLSYDTFSDDNERWEFMIAPRRQVLRNETLNLDIGVHVWRHGFDEDPNHGYYAPELYQRYALTGFGYWKINDDNGTCRTLCACGWLKMRKAAPSQMNHPGRGCGLRSAPMVVSQITYSCLRWRLTLRPNLEVRSIIEVCSRAYHLNLLFISAMNFSQIG